MESDPPTEQLEALQRERELTERERADDAPDEHESAQHERRAEKAGYLRRKLQQRAASEREASRRDDDS